MTTPHVHLALYLDAPLQSWGYQSRFDRRTSLSYPTRSGIIGMVCAAMGIERGDVDGIATLAELKLTAYVFREGGRLIDFHTVGGGYDSKTQPQHLVKTASGNVRKDPVVTRREYLQDSRFGAVLSGQEGLVTRIASALRNPRWGIWLGRKSCIPASPVYQGTFGSISDAREHLARVAGTKAQRVVTEAPVFEDGTGVLMDSPIDFAKRTFSPRRIAED